jgi:hypothetical protein
MQRKMQFKDECNAMQSECTAKRKAMQRKMHKNVMQSEMQ